MTAYSNLSEETRSAITRAFKMSRQLHFSQISPLVMMIAIVEESRETVSDMVGRMGTDMSSFCTALTEALPLPDRTVSPNIPISPELDRFLETAVTQARERGTLPATLTDVFEVMAKTPGDINSILTTLGCTGQSIWQAFQPATAGVPDEDGPSPCPDYLKRYARDLVLEAQKGKLDPVIGRDEETLRVIQILLRKTKNNPVLVGPAGTGKTAIAEGLAQRIASGAVPPAIRDAQVLSLDITSLIAGASVQGEFEDRLKRILKETKDNPDIILFIDEIHLLIGTGRCGGSMDAANILKPALSRSEIRLIGATTTEEYTKYIESDKALERRLQRVSVEEPDEQTALSILQGIKGRFEAFHGITIGDDAVRASVALSMRYISDRCLPDKAIDLLDEAAAKLKTEGTAGTILTEEHIRNVVTAMTGIPLEKLQDDDMARLSRLEETLSSRIIGQEDAITAVSKVLRRNRTGLGDPGRPIGSFLFLGPTGVGKTALAKTIAEYLFNSPDMMVRIDMSEYQQEHTVSRLFGAPPGYVGYDRGGQLTEAVRHRPYAVILLDEMEKAHGKVFETLLQVLDDGRMTDGQGRTVDFRNTIIIMTSNLDENRMRHAMSPEFLNRIDDIVCFNRLDGDDIFRICRLQMEMRRKKMLAYGVDLHFDEGVVAFICEKGYSPDYGAREIKRTINRHLVDEMAAALVRKDLSRDFPILATVHEGELMLENIPTPGGSVPALSAG